MAKQAVKQNLVSQKRANQLVKLIKNGKIDITKLSDNDKAFVDAYSEFFDKAMNARQAVEECKQKTRELAQTRLDNVVEQFETLVDFAESVRSTSESMVDYYAAAGRNVNGPETVAQINSQMQAQRDISTHINNQIRAYEAEMAHAAKVFGETSNEYITAKTKLQEMRTALTESNTALMNLNKQLMDINLKPLEYALDKLQSFGKRLESMVTLNQKRSIYPDEGDYTKQIQNNNDMIAIALADYEQRKNAIIANGWMENNENYQEYMKLMRQDLDLILQLRTENEDLKASILDSRWKAFDDLHTKIDRTIGDYDYLRSKIGDDEMLDDNGEGWNLTDKGIAAITLVRESMAAHKQNIVDYREALEKLNEQLKTNPELQDVINERSEEYIKKIREEVDAVEDLSESLTGLYKRQIQNEHDALTKVISARETALSAKKSYYDYDRQIRSQSKDINRLKAEFNALAGVSNAASQARAARLREQIADAEDKLNDTRYNHRIDLQQQGYDRLKDDAQKSLDDTFQALDANSDMQQKVVNQMLGNIRENYRESYDVVNNIIKDTGVVIRNATKNSINDLQDATAALGVYNAAIAETLKTTSSVTAQKIDTSKIITDTSTSNRAEDVVMGHNENDIASAAAQEHERQQRVAQIAALNDQITALTSTVQTYDGQIAALEESRDKNYAYYQNRLQRADKNKAVGDKKKQKENLAAAEKHLNNYNTLNQQIDALKRQKDADNNALQRLKDQLSQLNSYRRGTSGTLLDELAWTHDGEAIIRSDGAILRQLPTGTAVISKLETQNLWKWAQIDPFKELKAKLENISVKGGQSPVVNNYYDSVIHVDGNVDADMMERITELGQAIIKDRRFQNKMIDTVTKEYARDFKKRF